MSGQKRLVKTQPLLSLTVALQDSNSFTEMGQGRQDMQYDSTSDAWRFLTCPWDECQLAELLALTTALPLSEGQKISIYTDHDYMWLTSVIGQLAI